MTHLEVVPLGVVEGHGGRGVCVLWWRVVLDRELGLRGSELGCSVEEETSKVVASVVERPRKSSSRVPTEVEVSRRSAHGGHVQLT
jgi:hypothetical protein